MSNAKKQNANALINKRDLFVTNRGQSLLHGQHPLMVTDYIKQMIRLGRQNEWQISNIYVTIDFLVDTQQATPKRPFCN